MPARFPNEFAAWTFAAREIHAFTRDLHAFQHFPGTSIVRPVERVWRQSVAGCGMLDWFCETPCIRAF
jgi:hypothetical protein